MNPRHYFEDIEVVIPPAQISTFYDGFGRHLSGWLMPGTWHTAAQPLEDMIKYRACIHHFRDGVPWSETGIFEFSMDVIKTNGWIDEYKTLDEVKGRYREIDRLYEEIAAHRALKSARTLYPDDLVKRAYAGLFVHIGPQGRLIFGAGGIHRLAISHLLKLENVPAQLGCVHPGGVDTVSGLRPGS